MAACNISFYVTISKRNGTVQESTLVAETLMWNHKPGLDSLVSLRVTNHRHWRSRTSILAMAAPDCNSNLCLGAVVLRVPMLYGEVESVMESAVTSLWQKVQEGATESCTLDHCQQRFPTDARDVAAVCRKICESGRQVEACLFVPLSASLSLPILPPVSLPTSLRPGPVHRGNVSLLS